MPARNQDLGELQKRSSHTGQTVPDRILPKQHCAHRARKACRELRGQHAPVMYVFPSQQNGVLLERGLDEFTSKLLADGSAMFMEHRARRFIKNLPSALPCHEAQIGVLIVKGLEQRVESAEFQELPAVECAGPPAWIEARIDRTDGVIEPVPDLEAPVFPPRLGEAGFLPPLPGIGKENLAGDREDMRIAEVQQQRRKEIRLHSHVAVEEHHDVVFRSLKTSV